MKSTKQEEISMPKGSHKFQRMFDSAFLGPLEVKNRLVMAPVATRLASEIGGVTQRQIDYYAERAKGGVGAVIVECTSVDYPIGVGYPQEFDHLP